MRQHPRALYTDTTSSKVWERIPEDMTEGIVLPTDGKAIIDTSTTEAKWTHIMSEQDTTGAEAEILKLRWKTSAQGGAVWATPCSITAERREWFTSKAQPEVQVEGANAIHVQTTNYEDAKPEDTAVAMAKIVDAFRGQAKRWP